MRVAIRVLTMLLVLMSAIAMLPARAVADEFTEYPKTGAEALAYYEGNVDGWLDGPVQYLMLEDERRLFRSLESSAERAIFIDWFWDRRDDDLKVAGNAAREAFYERVALANDRYQDFPRGWKSNRGQVHVLLGNPHIVRPSFGHSRESVVWGYYTVGPRARDLPFGTLRDELTIAFTRRLGRYDYEFFGDFAGRGYLPQYVRDAFRYARQAAITEPTLELSVD